MRSRAFALILLGSFVAPRLFGQEIEVVLREGTNFAAALSPTDGSIVLDLQGTLWKIAADGGAAEALTDGLGDDRMPHFSSDGERVVFQSYRNGTWDIWSLRLDGSEHVPLTDSDFDDREPVLSADGSKLAFSSDRNGNYDIWLMDLDSGELTAITEHEDNDYMPDFTPSGDAVVFVSDRGGAAGLYRAAFASDAGEPSEMARFDGKIASPSVSPDGARVALRRLDVGTTSADANGRAADASRLVLVTVEDGSVSELETADDVFPFRAEWTADGALVYTANGALWKHPLDGNASKIPFEARVTLSRPAYSRRGLEFPETGDEVPVRGIIRPVVSPDGTRLAFAALGDIWTVPVEGGEPARLTRDEHLDSDPNWSPDSQSVVYSSDRYGSMDLWIKRIGTPARATGRQISYSLGVELAPAWSPDGTTIAFVDESARINTIPASGGTPKVLTPARFGVSQPTWSSNSLHIAYTVHAPYSTRFREGINRIHVLDTLTGEMQVLDVPERSVGGRDGDGPVWSPDGRSLAFAMDGALWVLPVSVNGTPTGAPRQVAGEAVDFPSWSPDSRSIYYVSPRGIKKVDVDANGRSTPVDVALTYEASTARGRFMIRDVTIVDGTSSTPRAHQDVVIDGNRIASVEPTSDREMEDVRVIDGAGKTLIPGLIEMHTHLSLPAWGSQHGKVWLAYGITSIRTPADAPYRVLEERESIAAGLRVGPRVFFTGGTMDGSRIYYPGALAVRDVEGLAQEMQRAFDLSFDLVKTYVRLPDDLQKMAIEEAHRQGIFVTSHELYPAVAYGIDGIEHIAGTSRRGYSPKLTDLRRSYDDVIELMARSKVFFTPTVLIYGGWTLARASDPDLLQDERFGALVPAWAQERFRNAPAPDDAAGSRDVMAPIYATVDAVHARGGRVVAGTDSPIIPYGLSLIVEIEQLSDAGLGPMAALKSATMTAAEALGASDHLGTVEEGKIADLVLLGADPSEDIRNLRKTEVVIVNGRLLSVAQILRTP